nr:hypothetical protein [uncultured Pseudomonas sp.]
MSLTTPAANPMATAVSAHFASRPDLATVARQLLTASIAEAFSNLSIDLSRTKLATPAMNGWTLQPFMPLVLAYIASGIAPDFSQRDGRHCFLTDFPPAQLKPAGQSALDMDELSRLVAALPRLLPLALQNALADYWRATGEGDVSRWRWLSDSLMDNLSLNVLTQADLSANERSMLSQLVEHPDRELRSARFGEHGVHAYYPHAMLETAQQSQGLFGTDLLLLCAGQGKPQVLLCPLAGPCERFTDLDAALQAWAERTTQDVVVERITLQRVEPDGNLFDTQAAIILNQQLQQLQALDLPARQGLDTLVGLYQHLTDPACAFATTPLPLSPLLPSLRDNAAPWLKTASSNDRARYRHYSLKLASAKKRSGGRTFLSDLPDIRTFTRTALLDQLKRDEIRLAKLKPAQSQIADLQPDDLQLTFSVAAGYPGGAGFVETVRMSLTDLAINNLQGQPRGKLTVAHRNALPLPAWLTADYIHGNDGLIRQVDIGKAYPELLKTHLMGKSEDTQQRQDYFAEQTLAQLPLLALELSLQQAQGFTAEGAAYVAALVAPSGEQRKVHGQAVVIRHLALVRKPQATPDGVANMYIIESESGEVGPHILYRPLYQDALRQFASRAHLLRAIAEPGELQESVLTWLSDGARPIYANGGFQQPHYVRFGSGDEFELPEVPKPAALAVDGVSDELLQFLANGHLMEYLYGTNARALVDQADRESVSNTESRWKVLMEGAGLIFGTLLLPLLRGPLMLTGWLMSLMAAAHQDIPALQSQDPLTRELAVVDLLLNVAMLLLQLAPPAPSPPRTVPKAVRRAALRSALTERPAEQWPAPPAPVIEQGPVLLENQAAQLTGAVFDFSFSSARNQLTEAQRTRLQGLQAPKPQNLPQPASSGPHQGLYYHLRDWYALIEGRWFQVRVDDGQVVIVDPFDSQRYGPYLQSDGQGNWSLDLRLRLRGGMPKKRIQAERERKALRIQQLSAEQAQFLSPRQEMQQGRLVTLDSPQQALQKKADIAQSLMTGAGDDPKYTAATKANTRRNFDKALLEQITAYESLLNTRQERRELGVPMPDDVACVFMENIVNNARKSAVVADLDRQAFYAEHPDFSGSHNQALTAMLADPPRYMQFLKDMEPINERQVYALELKDRYLLELFNLGQTGLEAYTRLTRDRPDELSALSLKYLQLQNLKVLGRKNWRNELYHNQLDSVLDPLDRHLRTHSELNSLNLDASDRMAVLDSLLEHYGQAIDSLQGLEIVHAEDLEMPYFKRLSAMIATLYQDVVRQLASEVKPLPQAPRRPPKRALARPGKPLKKVIKTRRQGYLIGDLKPAGGDLPIDTVEVRSEHVGDLLATYSQHENGWDELREERATPQTRPKPDTRELSRVKGEARKWLKELEAVIKRQEGYAQVSRFPVEIQESLDQEAARFNQLAAELDQALEALPKGQPTDADRNLVTQLTAAARTLAAKGLELRIQRTLELPPRDSHVSYLLEQDRIQMARLGARVALQGERRDFIQEYAVNDKRGYPLWYAHFHYPTLNTPKAEYSVAHLKTKAQRTDSYYSLLAKADNPYGVVEIHRGEISRALAERRFLPLGSDD